MKAPVLPRRWTLRTRLLAALMLIAASGLAAFGVLSVLLLDRSQLERVDAQLSVVAGDMAGQDRPPPPAPAPGSPQVPSDFRVMFFDLRGDQIGRLGAPGQAGTVPELPPMDAAAVAARGAAPFTVPDQTNTSIRWRVSAAVQAPNSAQPEGGTVAVAMSLATSDATTERLRTIELAAGIGLLAAMVLIAAVLVRIGLRPLARIEHTAEAIAGGDLDRRVGDTDAHTETGRLGIAFNVMVARLSTAMRQLEDSEQRMRTFVADASHELRTPLTTMRGYAELYRHGGGDTESDVGKLMERIEAAAIRMGLLVEDLLLLARLDEQRPLDLAEVDLGAIAADVVADARTRAPAREIGVDVPPTPRYVVGDENRLRQVVTNLVNNALVHTPGATTISVVVRVQLSAAIHSEIAAEAGAELPDADEYLVLEVADNGPGIPRAKAPHVFDRFYQASKSRSHAASSGLGLSIVSAILTAHGARIQLLTTPGAGATFRILFAPR
ncbi:two-component system, OmpR family, sensor kinase [Nocardia amikacinitolerans]|uniref:sensor histidine kinase n=1 Tax=Nocardia amikacinitolerans TaxID=756689 RepID=UPI0008369273|nr:HAMP domain-containing sensor histidine kinase [Nocardia amikacinitolerans]MCP2320116.1 two-component system, OmpR family, sensor kinase [Nocardia amikacinitolerans]